MEDRQISTSQVPAPNDGEGKTPPKYRVKFADGPAKGTTMEYDKERPTYKVGTWTYEATGQRDGDFWLYVKRPTQRAGRRLIRALSAAHSKDVRLIPKDEPNVAIHRGRNDVCWCGSGKKYKKCHSSPQSN